MKSLTGTARDRSLRQSRGGARNKRELLRSVYHCSYDGMTRIRFQGLERLLLSAHTKSTPSETQINVYLISSWVVNVNQGYYTMQPFGMHTDLKRSSLPRQQEESYP